MTLLADLQCFVCLAVNAATYKKNQDIKEKQGTPKFGLNSCLVCWFLGGWLNCCFPIDEEARAREVKKLAHNKNEKKVE